jgi:hypothetical protein
MFLYFSRCFPHCFWLSFLVFLSLPLALAVENEENSLQSLKDEEGKNQQQQRNMAQILRN